MKDQIEVLLNAARYKMLCARDLEIYGSDVYRKSQYYEELVNSLENAFATISAIDKIKDKDIREW